MSKVPKNPSSTALVPTAPQDVVEVRWPFASLRAGAPVGLRGLVEDTGVAERSVQRWVTDGLLPAPLVGQHPGGRGRQGVWHGSVRRLCNELAVRRRRGRERSPLWPFRLAAWMPTGSLDSADDRDALAQVDALEAMQFAVEVFIGMRQRVGPNAGGPRFPDSDEQALLFLVCLACAQAGWPPVLVVGERRVVVAPAVLLGALASDGAFGGAWVVIDLGWPLACVGIVGEDASRARETTVGLSRCRDRVRPTYEVTRDGQSVELELHEDVLRDWLPSSPEEDPEQ